jgi:hypothetical protein
MDPRILDAAKDVRRECAEDYVGLWWLPGTVRHHLPTASEADRKSFSLQIVEQLLADPSIVVGQFHEMQFQPWTSTAKEACDRISSELGRIGKGAKSRGHLLVC